MSFPRAVGGNPADNQNDLPIINLDARLRPVRATRGGASGEAFGHDVRINKKRGAVGLRVQVLLVYFDSTHDEATATRLGVAVIIMVVVPDK
jgi:hypothetical protein